MHHRRPYDRAMTAITKTAPVTIQERISVSRLQPEAYRHAQALAAAIAAGDLERSLIDLIDVRVSQLNGCAFCIELHTSAARRRGESDARLHALNAWEEASVFTARERAALALAEAVTLIREGHVPDAVWAAAAEQLSEAELADVILNTSMMNFWNRVAITSRTMPGKQV
jgi:AhpD family alkylhydroperoxidase